VVIGALGHAYRLQLDVVVDIFVVIAYIVGHDNFKLHLPP
jgi:hypothetical protein